jgi:hypothetical protein
MRISCLNRFFADIDISDNTLTVPERVETIGLIVDISYGNENRREAVTALDNEEKTKNVYLRDLFSLPKAILGIYESHDQFITLETEDGVQMLHIYHLDKSKAQSQKQIHRRLFCDHKTGWVYSYDKDSKYRKYKKVSFKVK